MVPPRETGAVEFSYHRHASGLRTVTLTLGMAAAFDGMIAVVLAVVLPRPWNYGAAALGLTLIAYLIGTITRVFRTRHRLLPDRLVLHFGGFRLEVPRAQLETVGPLGAIPAQAAARAETWPAYTPEDDTLYIVPHRKGLVELRLREPLSAHLSRFGPPVAFTRIILALDDPQAFLAAMRPSTSPAAAPLPHQRDTVETGNKPDTPAAATGTGAAFRQAPSPPLAPAARAGAAIVLERLTKRYGDFIAVRDVSLDVQPGEILAFLGSNGAGKSTTIRMMTGLLRPTAGRVLIGGRDVWQDGAQARRLIGYVPDTPLLYDSLTAQEFLWFVGGLYELEPAQARQRAGELLELLQITPWKDQLIRSFSLGMRRKMSIAAALMHQPKVLLLDEVTNGLDPRSARAVKDLILSEAARGASVFLTTHILDVASELGNRFAFIDAGQVLAVGTRAEIEAQLGLAGASLEELFLAVTGADDAGSTATKGVTAP